MDIFIIVNGFTHITMNIDLSALIILPWSCRGVVPVVAGIFTYVYVAGYIIGAIQVTGSYLRSSRWSSGFIYQLVRAHILAGIKASRT